MRIHAIIPAAGVGSRAQLKGQLIPKQYRFIGSQPMLSHTVRAMLADKRVDQVHIAIARDDEYFAQFCNELLESYPQRVLVHKTGGKTRAETVLQTLRALGLQEQDWVLVHDAARPSLPFDALERLLNHCLALRQGGLLAMPVADTVKLADDGQNKVKRTQSRECLWLAQTPQMFPAHHLQEALQEAERIGFKDITDEASAVEQLGNRPLLVRGDYRNLKVTWPEDFDIVQSWLSL